MIKDQKDLTFFDSNACVGKMGRKHYLQKWRTEEIIHEMDRCGMAGALIYHSMGKAYSPEYGNRLLVDEMKKSRRLAGCWVVMPHHLGDFPKPADIVKEMKEKGIVAAKMFPLSHRFLPDKRTINDLMATLEAEKFPLLIDASEIEMNYLSDILANHPDLTVVLQGMSWSRERLLFPVMDDFKNLCIDFSALQNNEMVEIAYERYGAERLIYGSGMPFKSPGAAKAFIDYARIPDEAKRLIAGGNLIKLTGFEPPEPKIPDQDQIMAEAHRGKPISIPVYDSHTHLMEDGGKTGGGRPYLRGDIDAMIKAYRAIGIDKMSIAPWIGIEGDSEAGNLVAEKAIERYPGEVVGYVTIDPNYVEDVAGEALKWHVEKGFKGMKPYYNTSRIRYTNKVYEPWFRLANSKKLYGLIDPGGYSDSAYLEDIEELARLYPDLAIFMDHGARSFEIAVDYAALAKKYDNIYLQLTFTSVTWGSIEYLVKEAGAKKILFGTDSPMRDPRPQLGWLAYADISYEDKKLIFGGNMKRILDRCLV